MYLKIEDYFQRASRELDSYEQKRVNQIRDELNSFKTLEDQVEYIKLRRSYPKFVKEDQLLFGISRYAELDKCYNNIDLSTTYNDNWTGEEGDLDSIKKDMKNSGKIGSRVATLLKSLKIIGYFSLVITILNVGLYLYGIYTIMGESPYVFCSSGSTLNMGSKELTKVKDGRYIPVDYYHAGEGYTGQNWDGPIEERGIGLFASEDFRFDGQGDSYSKENYAIAARWEYANYSVKTNMWPNHGKHGVPTTDGVDTSKPINVTDPEYYSWVLKQKVFVYNPENQKGVIVKVGNGIDNPNWGGSPLETIGGLTYLAQNALGFTAGGLEGEDYTTNVRDSGVMLEMWWAPEDAEVGPVHDGLVNTKSSKCSFGSSLLGYPFDEIYPVTSEFGERDIEVTTQDGQEYDASWHGGIDIGAPCGTPIKAISDGVVLYKGFNNIAGHHIHVEMPNGMQWRFLHMQEPSPLVAGDRVKAGQFVGKVGTTGASTGCHLHITIKVNGESINPREVMTFD